VRRVIVNNGAELLLRIRRWINKGSKSRLEVLRGESLTARACGCLSSIDIVPCPEIDVHTHSVVTAYSSIRCTAQYHLFLPDSSPSSCFASRPTGRLQRSISSSVAIVFAMAHLTPMMLMPGPQGTWCETWPMLEVSPDLFQLLTRIAKV
jgi:hypothetical protein